MADENLKKQANKSLGREGATYGCSTREYTVTRLCGKHFDISVIYKPPGGTRKRLLDGAKPILHAWYDFGKDFKKRKQPMLIASSRKICRIQTPLQLNFSDEELEVTQTPEISELDQMKEKLRNFKNDNKQPSEGIVSNAVTTWVNFIYLKLGSMCIWPDRKKIQMLTPSSMKENFPTTRCIIDCVEFKVEVPSSLYVHKMLYSDYKSHTTVKVLVVIAPGGGFTFIPSAYPGSISDKSIVIKSGFSHPGLWEKADSVMTDRGFTIEEYLKPLNVKLIIPAFLKGRGQFTTNEIVKSQQIARERIHVEQMIQRFKCYHIFNEVEPVSMMGSMNQIITVCGLLANF
ncbi:uncharacterized protein LOC130623114 [Hydractinia symbiolongicarpus]|uniref:uncharacterized protein LOC130623114 n=1 Tax=Hydractinia symbiolongicarpus TaxID=13093 RepID=UPI00254B3759|nr:uncharacterized protein LOC130623114 [Hydractinia symbiolongicarpus]